MESAQVVLQKALSQLVAQKVRTEREIRAVQTALASIGIASPALAARRRRKPMNAAERKLVSKRMKAYWAKKRTQQSS
jgi:hypothetical protein